MKVKNPKRHWCPAGCGKSVEYTNWNHKVKSWTSVYKFSCNRCNKYFTKKELDKFKNEGQE